ncbi:MAG: hypothetical protein ACREBU_03530 [Nitrososphaera sp.]
MSKDFLFIHIRDHDTAGELLPRGGATIAYKLTRQSDFFHIEWAIAECMPTESSEGGDHFVKQIGRDISSARLSAGNRTYENVIASDQSDGIQALLYTNFLERKKEFIPNIDQFYYPHKCGFNLRAINPAAIVKEEE